VKAKEIVFAVLFVFLILVVINMSQKLGELNQTVKALTPKDNPVAEMATVVTGFASGLPSI
jgi:uncharacterized protein YoxC